MFAYFLSFKKVIQELFNCTNCNLLTIVFSFINISDNVFNNNKWRLAECMLYSLLIVDVAVHNVMYVFIQPAILIVMLIFTYLLVRMNLFLLNLCSFDCP